MSGVLIAAILVFQILLVLALFFIASMLAVGIFTVPWVPTRKKIGRAMFELAELKPGETVVDLGCGDSSLLLIAVKEFGAAKGVGYEIHPGLHWLGKLRARFARVSNRIDLRGGNFFKAELLPAEVVITYLFPETQARLEPLLKKYYPSGTRIISRAFKYPSLPLLKTAEVQGETLYLYQIP